MYILIKTKIAHKVWQNKKFSKKKYRKMSHEIYIDITYHTDLSNKNMFPFALPSKALQKRLDAAMKRLAEAPKKRKREGKYM